MKQYRPVSADFTKVGALSAVFGLAQENAAAAAAGIGGGVNQDPKGQGQGGVMLINCE